MQVASRLKHPTRSRRPAAQRMSLSGLAERIRRFDVFTRIAAFFSQMAAVTFGGGDAMLA